MNTGWIVLIWLVGIAYPTPVLLRVPNRTAIRPLIPSRRPCKSISGPPELPGLIAASVWIASL